LKCRDLQFGLELIAVGTCKSALGSFVRAISITSLVCASLRLLGTSCSRLWGNRANEGDICGVGNGPFQPSLWPETV